MNGLKALLAPVSIVGITILSGAVLLSINVSADDSVVDQINITVPVSCTMSGTGMNTHNAEIQNGTYTPNIGTTIIHAFCNDAEGFAIYAAGYTGDEIGGANSNKLVGTAASSNATIETGLATSAGNPDVSNWAMKLAITQDSGDTTGTNAYAIDSAPNTSGGADASFNQYHVVPNEYTKVAHKNSATDMTANTGGVKLTTTYAVYISKTQPADTYSGQVIYTLVHPASANAPVACRPSGTTIDAIVCMQDINPTNKASVFASMAEGTAYLLYDSRDEQRYHVAKLADGNIWMLDNLALDPTDSATARNMNSTNTNATQDAITNLLNGGSTITGWSSVAVTNASSGWDANNNDARVQPWINNTSKDILVTSYGPASANGQARVGIYYNYCAASAGTNCYTAGGVVDKPDTLIDSPQDICPANWRMPTGGNAGEYYEISQEYGNNAANTNSLQYNLSASLAGQYLNNSPYSQGNSAFWWSSTYGNSYFMACLYMTSSGVFVHQDSCRNYASGLSMRCLVAE